MWQSTHVSTVGLSHCPDANMWGETLPHTGVDFGALISWQRGALDRAIAQFQDSQTEKSGRSTNTTRVRHAFVGQGVPGSPKTQPTQRNTRGW